MHYMRNEYSCCMVLFTFNLTDYINLSYHVFEKDTFDMKWDQYSDPRFQKADLVQLVLNQSHRWIAFIMLFYVQNKISHG